MEFRELKPTAVTGRRAPVTLCKPPWKKTGLSDRTPNLDIVLFLWAGLVLLFLRAVVLKDMLNIITIGVGFMVQAALMALILFK
jgi:hypothetical protein